MYSITEASSKTLIVSTGGHLFFFFALFGRQRNWEKKLKKTKSLEELRDIFTECENNELVQSGTANELAEWCVARRLSNSASTRGLCAWDDLLQWNV